MKTLQRNTKYYNSKTTDTVLAGLVLAETVGNEGLVLLSPVRNRAYEEILKELLSVIEVQDRVEVAVSDVSRISVAQ